MPLTFEVRAPVLHPTPSPYTLHPSPCTLHPTPYTLHPTPYTLHFTPYTLHQVRGVRVFLKRSEVKKVRLELSDTKVYEP